MKCNNECMVEGIHKHSCALDQTICDSSILLSKSILIQQFLTGSFQKPVDDVGALEIKR